MRILESSFCPSHRFVGIFFGHVRCLSRESVRLFDQNRPQGGASCFHPQSLALDTIPFVRVSTLTRVLVFIKILIRDSSSGPTVSRPPPLAIRSESQLEPQGDFIQNFGSSSGSGRSPLTSMSAVLLCRELAPIDCLWQATCSTLGINFDAAQHFATKRNEIAAALYEVTFSL